MPRAAALLILTTLFLGCDSAPGAAPSPPTPPPHEQAGTAAPATQHAAAKPRDSNTEVVLRGDDAKIMVFPGCAYYIDELTARRRDCPVVAVYEIRPALSDGRIQIFNAGEITEQIPLPDVSPGPHIVELGQGYYWSSNRETVPDERISCNLGTISTTFDGRALWSMHSDPSVYDYKPGPPGKEFGDPPADLAASFRAGDLGFAEARVPRRENLEARERGQLPEIQILGVGFVEGTNVNCGKGDNLDEAESPLRDVRVVSTVEHDGEQDIPVLKAGRFTVPRGVFEYPDHIRIVGKLKQP